MNLNINKKYLGIVFISCMLATVSVGLCINGLGVFYAPVAKSLNVMTGTFSLHGTISMIVTAITSLFVPRILRRYPLKRIILVGALMIGFSTMIMSLCNQVIYFYVLSAVRGVGAGIIGIVTLTMILNNWFIEKNGLITSIVLCFSGIAGAVFSPVFSILITSIGWQLTHVINGIIAIALCLPALLYRFTFTPEESQTIPYGYQEGKSQKVLTTPKNIEFNYMSSTFLIYITVCVMLTMVTGITQHLPGYAETVGQNATTGALLLSVAMVGNIISKLMIGFLSDSIGSVKATVIMIMVNTVGVVILITIHLPQGLLLGAILFGSIYSISAAGLPLLTRELFGLEKYGVLFPKVSFAANLGGAVTISLVGYIYDFTGTYMIAFTLALIINFLSIVMVFLLKKLVEN